MAPDIHIATYGPGATCTLPLVPSLVSDLRAGRKVYVDGRRVQLEVDAVIWAASGKTVALESVWAWGVELRGQPGTEVA